MPLLSREQIKFKVGKINFDRGKEYYETGAVSGLSHQGHTVRAKCQGSQADKYDVWVLVEPRVSDVQIKDAFCSCPVGDGGRCKHVAAVLLTWADSPAAQTPVAGGSRRSPSSVSPPSTTTFAKHHTVGTTTPYKPRPSFGNSLAPPGGSTLESDDTGQSELRPAKRLRVVPASAVAGGGEASGTARGLSGIDEEALGTMGIRRWNRRDPALRRRNTEEYRSTTHDGEDPRSSTDGNDRLLDHLQQEVAELRNLLERKERELEKEKQERRELRRVVRRQEETIGALQQRLRSAGLGIDGDGDDDHNEDEALAPTVDDDVDKNFDDKQFETRAARDEEEKRRDDEKLHVEQAKVEERKKERRTKESEEETMTLLLEAMDQEATLPADGYHHEDDGTSEQQLPKSEMKNENDKKNEENEEENEAPEALLRDMSPTLRFEGEYDDHYYAGEEAPSGLVDSDAKPPEPDADRSPTPPEELLLGKRKREDDDNTAAPAKVSLSALLRKHLSPLRASPHLPTADDPTDRSPSVPRARPPRPMPLVPLDGDAGGDDAEKLPRPSPGRVEVPRTPSPARDPAAAGGDGGERARQAVSPVFKALFLGKKRTAD